MNLYVGSLSYKATEDDLRDAFEPFGEVVSVSVIKDRETGQSRGFGFVEFATDDEGNEAMNALNGARILGRAVVVNEARPRKEGGGGGGGGGGRRPPRGPRR